MPDGQPPYLYANQWADDLASLYSVTMNSAPSMSMDLNSIPLPRQHISQIAGNIFQAQIPPYQDQ